jgi:hypothetical protein
MFCSGCGHALEPGQTICPQCSRPVAPPIPVPPPVPGFQWELERYAGKVKVLGILWLVYAGISLILGFAGLSFARAFISGGMGPWGHGPMFPGWFGPAWIHLAWLMLSLRAILCAVAGWGLLERAQWGRILAIVAAILCLIKIPLGTALGIATLVILLGYRNSTLYDQL